MNLPRLIFFFILITIVVYASATARAHDPGFSTTVVTVEKGEIRAVVTYSRADIEALGSRDFKAHPAFQIDESEVLATSPELSGEDDAVFRLTAPRRRENAVIFSNPLLDRLPSGHRQLLLVRDPEHAMLLQQYLHRGAPTATLDLSKFPDLAIRTTRPSLLAVDFLVLASLSLLLFFVFRRSPPLHVPPPPGR